MDGIAVHERPILFSSEMVRAIIDGRKTQTRRIVKPQPTFIESSARWNWQIPKSKVAKGCCDFVCTASREWWEYLTPEQMKYRVGDRLWVRESLRVNRVGTTALYAADGMPVMVNGESMDWRWERKSLPSIHMPREASRITLEITDVRVQQIQEIVGRDVAAEGFPFSSDLDQFKLLWKSINGPESWDQNPWVWALSFRRTA